MSKISKIKEMVRDLNLEDLRYLLDYIYSYMHIKEKMFYQENENSKEKILKKKGEI